MIIAACGIYEKRILVIDHAGTTRNVSRASSTLQQAVLYCKHSSCTCINIIISWSGIVAEDRVLQRYSAQVLVDTYGPTSCSGNIIYKCRINNGCGSLVNQYSTAVFIR